MISIAGIAVSAESITCNAANFVNDIIDHFFANGIVTASILSVSIALKQLVSVSLQLLAASSLPLMRSSG